MDKEVLLIGGKEYQITTFANAVATSCALKTKSAFSDALLFNVTYDLSGVSPEKDLDDLTADEIAKVISLRAKTPIITAKDLGLRHFILNSLNKGKDESDKVSLNDFNAKLLDEKNFDENGELSDDANETIKKYIKKVSDVLTKGTRNVYFISIPVSELTNGNISTWTPDYSDKPRSDVVAYEVDKDNLLSATMSAIAQMYATIDTNEEEEEK